LLSGAIVVPFAPAIGKAVLLFVVVICCSCCFGAEKPVIVVGFFIVVVCCDGGDDDTAADGSWVADDKVGDLIVFGIPHISDSVVLTALRLGLPGLHIFALSSGDTVILLPPAAGNEEEDDDLRGADGGTGEDECCAYTWTVLQTPKSNIPDRTENTVKLNVV
jgi:hypothetical protein